MHPFFRSPKYFILVIIGWLPVVAGIIALHHLLTALGWRDALILLGPPAFILVFICLASWSITKAVPLDFKDWPGFLAKHLISAVMIMAVWAFISMMYSEMLNIFLETTVWRDRFQLALPLLASSGLIFYFLSVLANYLFIAFEKISEAEQKLLENQLAASEAQLNSLKTMVHPHFLFNSLTALSSLSELDPKKARQLALQLAEFLRYSINYSKEKMVTVKDEIRHIRNYLEVEQTRLGDRLISKLEVDSDAEPLMLSPFLLLPLVENAVKHGIQQLIKGGTVYISISRKNGSLAIEVTNPYDSKNQPEYGEKYGLDSLKRRLEAVYDDDARLYIHKFEKVFSVKLNLPVIHAAAE